MWTVYAIFQPFLHPMWPANTLYYLNITWNQYLHSPIGVSHLTASKELELQPASSVPQLQTIQHAQIVSNPRLRAYCYRIYVKNAYRSRLTSIADDVQPALNEFSTRVKSDWVLMFDRTFYGNLSAVPAPHVTCKRFLLSNVTQNQYLHSHIGVSHLTATT